MLSNLFQYLFESHNNKYKKKVSLFYAFSFFFVGGGRGVFVLENNRWRLKGGEGRGRVEHGIFQIMRMQRKASAVRRAREGHFEAGVLAILRARW